MSEDKEIQDTTKFIEKNKIKILKSLNSNECNNNSEILRKNNLSTCKYIYVNYTDEDTGKCHIIRYNTEINEIEAVSKSFYDNKLKNANRIKKEDIR